MKKTKPDISCARVKNTLHQKLARQKGTMKERMRRMTISMLLKNEYPITSILNLHKIKHIWKF